MGNPLCFSLLAVSVSTYRIDTYIDWDGLFARYGDFCS
jgi:hypothetical protein